MPIPDQRENAHISPDPDPADQRGTSLHKEGEKFSDDDAIMETISPRINLGSFNFEQLLKGGITER